MKLVKVVQFVALFTISFSPGLFAQTLLTEEARDVASRLTRQDIPELRRKAEGGDARASNLLGLANLMGYGTKPNLAEGREWFRKSAEGGDSVGQYNLCMCYSRGIGAREDLAEAARWCQKAADQGLIEAQSTLGTFFSTQNKFAEAESLYRKTAEQGYFFGQWNLAGLYADGHGVPQDYQSAYMWLLIARSSRYGNPPTLWIEKDPEDGKKTRQFLDEEAAKLTPEQIAEARRKASEWLSAHQQEPLPTSDSGDETVSFFASHIHKSSPGCEKYSLDCCFGRLRISRSEISYISRDGRDDFRFPPNQLKHFETFNNSKGDYSYGAVRLRLEDGKEYEIALTDDHRAPRDPWVLASAFMAVMKPSNTQPEKAIPPPPASREIAPAAQSPEPAPAAPATSSKEQAQSRDPQQTIRSAKTVAVIGRLGEVKMSGRGWLDADPDRGKAKVAEALQEWGRLTVLDDPLKADLVLVVTEGNHLKFGVQGQLYDELHVFAGGALPDANAAALWHDEAREGFKALPATKVAQKFQKYVEELEKRAGH